MQSVRVPLIIYDPRPEADATRGTVSDELVEGIDLAPTFLEFFGGKPKPHILEGRSLSPLLHRSGPVSWRAICDLRIRLRHALCARRPRHHQKRMRD